MLAIYCFDVGGRSSFGWARVERHRDGQLVAGGSSIDNAMLSMTKDLEKGYAVTLGFECPLYMPVPSSSDTLGRGRPGEGDRSMFAPAGIYTAMIGLQQLAFVLRALGELPAKPKPRLQWRDWNASNADEILVWEAFVSKGAHSGQHDRDAATAAVEFLSRHGAGGLKSDLELPGEPRQLYPLSLAGCAILWSGLSAELELLREVVLVIRPRDPYQGQIVSLDL